MSFKQRSSKNWIIFVVLLSDTYIHHSLNINLHRAFCFGRTNPIESSTSLEKSIAQSTIITTIDDERDLEAEVNSLLNLNEFIPN